MEALDPLWLDFTRMFCRCAGEFGLAHLPDVGGMGDQAAWILDSFQILQVADHERRKEIN